MPVAKEICVRRKMSMGWEMVSTEVLSTVAITAVKGEWLFL